jgi:alpha-1,3-rhamnosyl/mannosyltransferase
LVLGLSFLELVIALGLALPLTVRAGAMGVAVAIGVSRAVGFVVRTRILNRLLGTAGESSLRATVLSALLAVLVVMTLNRHTGLNAWGPAARLALKVVVSTATFYATLLAIQPVLTLRRASYLADLVLNRRAGPARGGGAPVRRYVLDARTLTPHFPGIGRYVAGLSAAMLPQLASDERLTILFDPRHPFSVHPASAAEMIPVPASPLSLRQQWTVPPVLWRAGATLYHSPYYLMPYSPDVPAVLTAYDVIPLLFPGLSTWRARVLFRRAMEKALMSSRVVITLSGSARADLVKFFPFAADRIVEIAPAAGKAFAPPSALAAGRIHEKYRLPEFYVLYVGTDRPHKNLHRLLEAWRRLRSPVAMLVLAGCAGHSDPDGNIVSLGRVPDEDLPALYGAATAFVFPSLCEGFGFPVLEALACGTPVLCSSARSLREVAGDAALYFDALQTDSILEALERLFDDAALRERLKEAGPARAQAFSWQRAAAETLGVYRLIGA